MVYLLFWFRFSWIGIRNTALKGQSKEIFDPQFFHHSNWPGSLTNGLKCFQILFCFCRDIQIFTKLRAVSADTAQSQAQRSIILRGVKFRAVQYCAESSDFSVSFLKGQSSKIFELFFFIIRVCLGHWVMGWNIFKFGFVFAEIFEFF